jgi:hypothetical protein
MAVLPETPDFIGAAEKTAASAADAANKQTVANRPNQTDPYGNKSSWVQDPTTGQWTQSTTLSSGNQGLYDQQQQIQSGLLGQAGANFANPLDTSGLPQYQQLGADGLPAGGNVGMLNAGSFNMDPTGNSKAIQDATYGLLSPQRTIERNKEVQRLKNMGLTEGSPAFQAAMTRLDSGDTDAQLKSLLAGTTEYGNIYNRALEGNQQNFNQQNTAQTMAETLRGNRFGENKDLVTSNNALRDKMMAERQTLRDQPLADLKGLLGASAFQKPEFSAFANATNPGGVDYTTAVTNKYDTDLKNTNAQNAESEQKKQDWLKLIGGVAGSDVDWSKWYDKIFG